MTIKINMLTMVKELPERWRGNIVYLWRCDCGQEKALAMVRVKGGGAKSCGCLLTKHGHAGRAGKSAEYVAWQAMHARCRAKRGRDYDAYGARGISVCERWSSFDSFLSDMGARPSSTHSVGRINNDLGYSPDNCQWETPEQQQRNRRDSLTWHIAGKTFESTRQAAAHFGVDHKTIRYWVKTSKEGCYVVSRY